MKGAPEHIVNSMMQNNDEEMPERFKPLVYPFEFAWEKVEEMKKNSMECKNENQIDKMDALQKLRCQEI